MFAFDDLKIYLPIIVYVMILEILDERGGLEFYHWQIVIYFD